MGRRKSGNGGFWGLLLIGGCALVAQVPAQAWFAILALGGFALTVYLVMANRKDEARAAEPEEVPKARSSGPPAKCKASPALAAAAFPDADDPRFGYAGSLAQHQPVCATPAVAPLRSDQGPVSVYKPEPAVEQSAAFRIPPRPSPPAPSPGPASSAPVGPGRWIGAGQPIEIHGAKFWNGLVYVGTSLRCPSGGNDPALIDPTQRVAPSGDYTIDQLGYWPDYSSITPSARRAYLNWLAGGRKDPEADIGYAFLFFYGLERRVLVDGAKDISSHVEWPVIATELRRLLEIYGRKSGSFRRYAGELLNWVSMADLPSRSYESPVPEFPDTYELPLYMRLVLGQAAVDGAPLPMRTALAWAKLDPTISLRTPAVRCREEFEKLFASLYEEAFKVGMVLPRNKTKLKVVYRPASSAFRGGAELKLAIKDIPDVSILTGPVKKLQDVVNAATAQLDSYSRLVGKSPEAKHSLEALLLLPIALWPEQALKALDGLKLKVVEGDCTLAFKELTAVFGASGPFSRERVVALVRSLEGAGLGFEPDMSLGARAPKPEDVVVLFPVGERKPVPRVDDSAYGIALLTLQLASSVAAADGDFGPDEAEHLRATVRTWAHLKPSHARRLMAHVSLLQRAPVTLASLKKRIDLVEPAVKQTLAEFMATVAQADGTVSPSELKMLEKVYKTLGVDPKKVFSDVHAASTDGVKSPASGAGAPAVAGFKLDAAKIAQLHQDTEKVSALLSNIFAENEPQEVPAAASSPGSATPASVTQEESDRGGEPKEGATTLMGLDEAHSVLVRLLLSRPEWTRDELQDAADDLELMLDGSLENINEAAFDAFDMPLFEGDDPVTVNTEILERLAA